VIDQWACSSVRLSGKYYYYYYYYYYYFNATSFESVF